MTNEDGLGGPDAALAIEERDGARGAGVGAAVGERFDAATLAELRQILGACGAPLCKARQAEETLRQLRQMYEPFLCGFSETLLMPLPAWVTAQASADNWRTSAWGRIAGGPGPDDEHS